MTDNPARKVEYGVTPIEVMASMTGIDFLRAMFDGKLPAPPIMQNIEPFDYSVEPGVVAFSSIPGFRHYNPIGSVHGGYAATLLDLGDGPLRALHVAGRLGLHHARIQGQLHPRHDQRHRRGADRGPGAQCRAAAPPRQRPVSPI